MQDDSAILQSKKRPLSSTTAASGLGTSNDAMDIDSESSKATTAAPNAAQKQSSSSSGVTPPLVQFPYYGEHKRAVSAVALAPSRVTPESPVCASASADGTVKLWKVLHHEMPPSLVSDKQSYVVSTESLTGATPSSVSFIPTSSLSFALPPLTTLVGHSRGINDVSWSPLAGQVATASDDKTLRLWDAETSDPLVEFRGHSNFVFCVRFNHPQANLLVSGSFDETVKLWDVRTGECVSTLPAHSDPVTGVDTNRDGTCVVSGSHDGLTRIWDTATGECLKTFFARGNPPVSSVRYSPNGRYILTGTLDETLRLWKVGTQSHCVKTYQGHANTKYCVASAFLVDAASQRQAVVTGSETGNIHVYDLNGQQSTQVLKGHTDAVLAVACHEKEEYLCSGGMTNDRTVRFWAPKKLVPKINRGPQNKDDDDDDDGGDDGNGERGGKEKAGEGAAAMEKDDDTSTKRMKTN